MKNTIVVGAFLATSTLTWMNGICGAAITTYTTQSGFVAGVSPTAQESFEGLPAGNVSAATVVTAGFNVVPDPSLIGVVTGNFFGAVATDGVNLLGIYRVG